MSMTHSIAATSIALLTFIPLFALAHEHQVFEINGVEYEFAIGSLAEPVVVDDKTGVDLRIAKSGPAHAEGGDDHDAGMPISGLEESLKVELIAGDAKKVLDLSPVYNTPGAYKAPFFPTIATTLSYRVFGDLEGTPIDLTFTCNPAGHAPAPEDANRMQISDKVVRTLKSGSFGCPVEKAEMGFPEESASILQLKAADDTGTLKTVGAGSIALVALVFAFMRRRV